MCKNIAENFNPVYASSYSSIVTMAVSIDDRQLDVPKNGKWYSARSFSVYLFFHYFKMEIDGKNENWIFFAFSHVGMNSDIGS